MRTIGIRSRRNSAFSLLLWLVLACTVIVVSSILFDEYRAIFHSDGAIKSVLAQMAWDEGRFVPRQWVYANGDLMFVGPQFFAILLQPLTGINYESNATADWLVYLCLIAAVYGTCRSLDHAHPRAAIASAAVIAGGLSYPNFEFVIGQGTYGGFAALALVLFALAAREADGTRSRLPALVGALIVSGIVCSPNPTRAWVTILLPAVVGWVASNLFRPAPTWRARFARLHSPLIYAVVFGALAGTAIYRWVLLPSMLNIDAAARLALASPMLVLEHLRALPAAWFEYFRIAGAWSTLSPGLRVIQSLAWMVAVIAVAAPAWVVATPARHGPRLHAFAWIVIAAYATSLGALVLSSELFTGAIEIRYATFAICGSLCVAGLLFDGFGDARPQVSRYMLFALAVGGLTVSLAWRAIHPLDFRSGDATFAEREALIEKLETAGVGATLSNYWQSHVTTVLSEGRVVGYPAVFNTQMSAFVHHMPRAAINTSSARRQAVVLTRGEAAAGTWNAVEYELGAPSQKLDTGAFQAWIYDRDIVRPVLGFGYESDHAVPPERLRVRLSRLVFPPCGARSSCDAWIDATNTGQAPLATAGMRPLRLGLQGLDTDGGLVVHDLGRVDFPHPIASGASDRVKLNLPPSQDGRVSWYRICLVQENVAWLCDRTQGPSVHGEIDAPVDPAGLAVALDTPVLPACRSSNVSCVHDILVRNQGGAALTSRGAMPLRIGVQGLDDNGQILQWDVGRADFPQALVPGKQTRIQVVVPTGLDERISRIRLCLLQEGIAWYCDKTTPIDRAP